jgi:hypothetical protein
LCVSSPLESGIFIPSQRTCMRAGHQIVFAQHQVSQHGPTIQQSVTVIDATRQTLLPDQYATAPGRLNTNSKVSYTFGHGM